MPVIGQMLNLFANHLDSFRTTLSLGNRFHRAGIGFEITKNLSALIMTPPAVTKN
jgi:hypothetical protein